MSSDLTVIVLAAGGGTRMKSKKSKLLHEIGGRSMVGHVLAAVRGLEPARVVAVVGHQREQVGPHIQALMPEAMLAVQADQQGTGHAVRIAVEAAGTSSGTVLVVYGDTPLLEGRTLRAFAQEHHAAECAVSVLSGVVADPFGYGRIVRNDEGDVEAIVEERDATPIQRDIHEIGSGIFAFDGEFLADVLPRLDNDNAKGEYYLTDTVALAREAGLTVGAFPIQDVIQTEGANDRVQLAHLGRELNRRIVEQWMRDGVTVMDPDSTWIESDVKLAPDVVLLPNTQLLGATVVAEDAVVGPDTTLKDCEIGAGARVVRSHGELAVIGDGANVGPYAALRPGTELGSGGKIGTFVEVKNSHIGAGAKVPHLSYVGDADIGEGSNIGAGTVFANYDGTHKHRTTVGKGAKTGANNTFVAPVTIGDGAMTGGGAVVRRDVPPGNLAVSGGPQRNLDRRLPREAQQTSMGASGEDEGES
jgi:bifunctional UDP-N-acetylglucosamine pyrophosphorylase/glucosamine-1-phosphate N-acetyltransferase